jgi:hypothetical protein
MALQSSGAISISQIKAELGNSSNSLRTLSAAVGKSAPDSMSEFYGYSAYTPPSYVSGADSISGAGTAANPYIVTKSFSNNNFGVYDVYGPGYFTIIGYVLSYMSSSVVFKVETIGSQRVNYKITTWNNNSVANCPLSGTQVAWSGPLSYYVSNPTDQTRGTDKYINVTYSSPYANWSSLNQQVILDAQASQTMYEEYYGDDGTYEYYGLCPDSLITTAFTIQIWFNLE